MLTRFTMGIYVNETKCSLVSYILKRSEILQIQFINVEIPKAKESDYLYLHFVSCLLVA